MSVTVSSFYSNISHFSPEQISRFREADVIFCETKEVFHEVMDALKIDVSNKEIFYTFSSKESRPKMLTSEEVEELLPTIKDKNIVIVSDDGFPDLVDPYTVLISSIIESGIRVDIVPQASAVLSAKMLSKINTDGYIFGGMLAPNTNFAILQDLSVVADRIPVIFFTMVPTWDFMAALQESLINLFGPGKRVTMLFDFGSEHGKNIECQIEEMYTQNALYFYDAPFGPMTLVLHP